MSLNIHKKWFEEYSYREIRHNIRVMMKHHIGKPNAITSKELFFKLYGMLPQDVDIYKFTFLWAVVKRIIADMRKDDIFIVLEVNKAFVLQTKQECVIFVKHLENLRVGLRRLQTKAVDWVDKEKWKDV